MKNKLCYGIILLWYTFRDGSNRKKCHRLYLETGLLKRNFFPYFIIQFITKMQKYSLKAILNRNMINIELQLTKPMHHFKLSCLWKMIVNIYFSIVSLHNWIWSNCCSLLLNVQGVRKKVLFRKKVLWHPHFLAKSDF